MQADIVYTGRQMTNRYGSGQAVFWNLDVAAELQLTRHIHNVQRVVHHIILQILYEQLFVSYKDVGRC